MFNHENGIGVNQPEREHGIQEQLVQILGVVGFGHTDVVRLQMPVHGQGQKHHVKQASLDWRQVEVVQAVAHVPDVLGADHALPCKGPGDGGMRLEGGRVEHFGDDGRFLVDAFHQQQKVLGEGGQDRRDVSAVNGLKRL